MTEDHHAETHLEATRLRRLGGGLVTDSFGEARRGTQPYLVLRSTLPYLLQQMDGRAGQYQKACPPSLSIPPSLNTR
jgi:hypothetical protein